MIVWERTYGAVALCAVYTVQIADAIWVLHFFQKKSRKGVKTPKPEIALIKKRLKNVIEHDIRERARRGH